MKRKAFLKNIKVSKPKQEHVRELEKLLNGLFLSYRVKVKCELSSPTELKMTVYRNNRIIKEANISLMTGLDYGLCERLVREAVEEDPTRALEEYLSSIGINKESIKEVLTLVEAIEGLSWRVEKDAIVWNLDGVHEMVTTKEEARDVERLIHEVISLAEREPVERKSPTRLGR